MLSFVSAASGGEENYAGLVVAVRRALADMMSEGVISGEVGGRFDVPTYNRTLADVTGVLDEVVGAGVWRVESLFERRVEHPASGGLEEQKRAEGRRRHAEIVVDWFTAVVAGYFVKALRVVHGQDLNGDERLVKERRGRSRISWERNASRLLTGSFTLS